MRILFVENNPELTSVVIPSFLSDHDVTVVASIASARTALTSGVFDAVFVDYDLDEGKGDDLLRWIAARPAPTPPIVAISSHQAGNDALVAAGASSVCPKLRFNEIAVVLAQLTSSS
jgi:CheY-like chemotaxis protein